MFTIKCQKNADIFVCDFCDFKCIKKSNFQIHVSTQKHKKNENDNKNGNNDNKNDKNGKKKCQKNALPNYICECGYGYSHLSGLSRHRKKCLIVENKETDNSDQEITQNGVIDLKDLVLQVVKQNKELLYQNNEMQKQNKELTNQLFEICKNNTTTNNSNNVNSHNKTFNLNIFLNEHCKDAMNITDFVDSLQLQLSDLENVGKLGYVNGISKIIINNLNALDETKRPIHCTDSKREVLYIKDENKWEKDNDNNNNKIRKVIKKIAHKNCKLLPEFKEKHPDCNKSDSRYSDQYNKMIVEAMGGSGDNDKDKEDKIIKNIAKEVQINKSIY
jgi:hypothetical protein